MKKFVLLLLVLVLSVGSSQAAIDDVYDLSADWVAAMPTAASPGVNPNGAWSYGHNPGLTQAGFALNTYWEDWSPAADALASWMGPGQIWPLQWHSYSYNDAPSGAGPGENVLQSGVNNPGFNSVTRWTAPNAGEFNIDINAINGYDSEGTEILLNDTILQSAAPGGHAYNADHLLAAGDTIDFVLLGQTATSNAIRLAATITEIPEPATMILLGMGGLALLRRRR